MKKNVYNSIYLSEQFNSLVFKAVEITSEKIYEGLKNFLKQKKIIILKHQMNLKKIASIYGNEII